jgi:peptide/nickel transport system substrate-binding protein
LYETQSNGENDWPFAGIDQMRSAFAFCVFFSLLAAGTPVVVAAPLQVAIGGDAGTLDPHALNSGSTTIVTRQVYETLVSRDRGMAKAPGLASSWSLEEPTRWRFILRRGVQFHDGAVFDADDVVFSIERARAPTSDFRIFASSIREVRRVDAATIDIVTDGPDPVLPDKLTRIFIMDAEWSRKHGIDKPQDFRNREDSYAVRNANGTGPYRLLRREAESRTEFIRFDRWWGGAQGNVEQFTYLPIANDATRIGALLAGNVDLVLDVPPQSLPAVQRNANLKIVTAPENRTIFLAMNQERAELPDSDVKGRNPFKDVRVRRAIYQAIDIEAIHRQTMRNQSVPAGAMWAPSVWGYAPEEDVRLPLDRAAARRLLTEAGYPSGFSVRLDCSNNRYVNDEHICVAVAAMLAQIGITVRVNAQPFSTFVAPVQRRESSFYLLGWASATFDALVTLQAILRSPGKDADGSFNFSGYSNPAVDALIDAVKTETDPGKRFDSMRRAHRLHNADVGHIPLHHQTISWAMRADIDVAPPAENQIDMKWVNVSARR